MSTPEYIRKILLPTLESTYHYPQDHGTLIALRTTSIAELDWLPLNVTSLPDLLRALHIEAAIWSPVEDGRCRITDGSVTDTVHLQASLETLALFHPDTGTLQRLTMQFHDAITAPIPPDTIDECPTHSHSPKKQPIILPGSGGIVDFCSTPLTWWHL